MNALPDEPKRAKAVNLHILICLVTFNSSLEDYKMNEDLKNRLVGFGLSEDQISALVGLGVNDDTDMSLVTEADLVGAGVKVIVARKIVQTFRPEAPAVVLPPTTSDTATKPEDDKSVANMLGVDMGTMMLLLAGGGSGGAVGGLVDLVDPITLLSTYNPRKPGHPIARILKAAYGDRRVIAFKPGTATVAVAETAQYLRDLEAGYDELEYLTVDSVPVDLYKVGVIPNDLVPENPLQVDEPLRGFEEKDSYTNMSWKGISQEKRQFARLAILPDPTKKKSEPEVILVSKDDHQDFIERVAKYSMAELKSRYPRTAILFDKLDGLSKLPPLKVELGARRVRVPAARPLTGEGLPGTGRGFPFDDER